MNIIQDKQIQKKFDSNKKLLVKPQVIGDPLLRPSISKQGNSYVTPSCKINAKDVQSSTSRSKSTSTINKESHTIVSVCEGRGTASGTVGLAAVDIHRPTLILSQIIDTHTYTGTLTKLNILQPVEVLVPATFMEGAAPSRLPTIICTHFPNMTITSVPRSEFNRTRGLHYISTLCALRFNSVIHQLNQKFYATAAASALMRYVEHFRKVMYAPRTIKVEFQEPEDTTAIDFDSADLLELVEQQNSLFKILNRCETGPGQRLLRMNILKPPCHRQIIEARLDCVEELLENPQLLSRLQELLKPLAEVDQALTFATVVPVAAANVSERQLNYTLRLKGLLLAVGPLVAELRSSRHPLFQEIYSRCSQDDAQKQILKLISDVVNDDAHLAKGHAGEIQRCFSLKSGLNGFLDLKRRVYTEGVDRMRAYVDELSSTHNLPLRVQHTIKNGFHIVLPLTKALRNLKKNDLPDVFINVERFSNHFSLTTQDMINFDHRLKKNAADIQSISNVIIHKLLTDIRPHIGHLYQVCDDVAQLDMLVSLAQASTAPNYVRPHFTDTYMELIGARHPILERICEQELIANDVIAYPRNNLHVLTGPNMSGKSVFIRSLCLLQILAQVGCWVPCSKATFRVCDRIFVRVAVEDSLEGGGASSFTLEMARISYLLATLSANSLVILDELCRTTASDEGAALALTICEDLQKTSAFTFVATHFISLTVLADLYPNVTNWNMETLEESRHSNSRTSLKFTFRVLPGITNIDSYGIKFSKIFNGSQSISDRAEVLYNFLLPLRKTVVAESGCNSIEYKKYKLQAELDLLQIKKQLTPQIQKQKITEFQNKTGIVFEPSPFKTKQSNSTVSISDNKTSTSSGIQKDETSSRSSSHVFFITKSQKSSSTQKHIFSFDTNDIIKQNVVENSSDITKQPERTFFDSSAHSEKITKVSQESICSIDPDIVNNSSTSSINLYKEKNSINNSKQPEKTFFSFSDSSARREKIIKGSQESIWAIEPDIINNSSISGISLYKEKNSINNSKQSKKNFFSFSDSSAPTEKIIEVSQESIWSIDPDIVNNSSTSGINLYKEKNLINNSKQSKKIFSDSSAPTEKTIKESQESIWAIEPDIVNNSSTSGINLYKENLINTSKQTEKIIKMSQESIWSAEPDIVSNSSTSGINLNKMKNFINNSKQPEKTFSDSSAPTEKIIKLSQESIWSAEPDIVNNSSTSGLNLDKEQNLTNKSQKVRLVSNLYDSEDDNESSETSENESENCENFELMSPVSSLNEKNFLSHFQSDKCITSTPNLKSTLIEQNTEYFSLHSTTNEQTMLASEDFNSCLSVSSLDTPQKRQKMSVNSSDLSGCSTVVLIGQNYRKSD